MSTQHLAVFGCDVIHIGPVHQEGLDPVET
jgi:hypothetical protein